VAGIELVDLGLLNLRGLSDPIDAFGVGAECVPWLDRVPTTVGTPVGNLPAPVDEWFGSVAELRRRVAELPRRRLVTLTGTAGVGKTRLALEVARWRPTSSATACGWSSGRRWPSPLRWRWQWRPLCRSSPATGRRW